MTPTGRYSRRRFMGTAAEATALGALALALKPLAAIACADDLTLTVYDPRFPAAEPTARRLAGVGRLLRTHGDPTSLLVHWTALQPGFPPPRLQGVTTESIPFCLEQCRPGSRLRQERLDRDLFVWHIEGA